VAGISKRAAIYIRQCQTSDGTISPALQEQHVREFISRQKDRTPTKVYADIDISGRKTANRPGLLALVADYKTGEFEIAVADDYSRFSRDMGDGADLIGSMEVATYTEGVPDPEDDFAPLPFMLLWEGWTVVETFTDDSFSGDRPRANADKALRMLRENKADVIAVYNSTAGAAWAPALSPTFRTCSTNAPCAARKLSSWRSPTASAPTSPTWDIQVALIAALGRTERELIRFCVADAASIRERPVDAPAYRPTTTLRSRTPPDLAAP
jgi:hypothetical protein